jgi:hypothetical protein
MRAQRGYACAIPRAELGWAVSTDDGIAHDLDWIERLTDAISVVVNA